MKVKELLKELSECPERREELLGSSIFLILVYTAEGRKEVGHGFEDLLRVSDELYEGKVTKEKWLDTIEYDLNRLDGDGEVGFNVMLFDSRVVEPYVPMKFTLKDIKLPEMIEVVDVEYRKEPPPPYRSKMKPYDKRRNFKPKNFWNRIRSRCK